jgi:hypothetical protein
MTNFLRSRKRNGTGWIAIVINPNHLMRIIGVYVMYIKPILHDYVWGMFLRQNPCYCQRTVYFVLVNDGSGVYKG